MKPLSKQKWEKIKETENLLNDIRETLQVNTDQIINKINKLVSENDKMKKEIAELSSKDNKTQFPK